MNCDQSYSRLNALADNELNVWQAFRVRRHLAACPACTAQLTAIQRLDTSVHAWRDAAAPAALGIRIAAALPPAAPLTVRCPFPIRRTVVGLAGAAAAVAAGFWLLPGHPVQPTIAFADVEQAMAKVNVMDWTSDSTDYGKGGIITKHQVAHIWMRRTPAAVATIVLPEPYHPKGPRTLEDKRGLLSILPDGEYVVRPGHPTVFGTVAAYTSLLTGPLRMLTKGQLGERGQPGKVQQTTLNGKPAFKVTLVWYLPNELQTALWIDPVTKRVTQMASRSTANGKLVYSVRETQMCYNQTPPPGVFDWSPPPGAKVEHH